MHPKLLLGRNVAQRNQRKRVIAHLNTLGLFSTSFFFFIFIAASHIRVVDDVSIV
eukprot:COSAG01_NODE_9908_length_2303_cov_29.165154_3_plen_55_part_00